MGDRGSHGKEGENGIPGTASGEGTGSGESEADSRTEPGGSQGNGRIVGIDATPAENAGQVEYAAKFARVDPTAGGTNFYGRKMGSQPALLPVAA